MRQGLNEKLRLSTINGMTDDQRHMYLEFMWKWLVGQHMGHTDEGPLVMWTKISQLFPPRLTKSVVPLYRLVTLPKKYANLEEITVKPAPGPLSSWSSKLVGLESVMGVASDKSSLPITETARIGYRSEIPSDLILATPLSIKNAFLTLSHDYIERYPEVERTYRSNNRECITLDANPNWPGRPDSKFDLSEVDYLRDVTSRKGGSLRQYECIVKTPSKILMKRVKVFRIGDNIIHYGDDDPHA